MMWDVRPPMDGPMPDTDDVVWLTYDALSTRLGITPESCRNLVRRRRWARQDGNDRVRRIGVPQDYLSERDEPTSPIDTPIVGGTDGDTNPPMHGGNHVPHNGGMVVALAALERHVERIEAELDHARDQISAVTAERDEARAALAEIGLLRVQLDAHRCQLEAAQQDRDRWHAEAEQDRAVRRTDAETARANAEAVRAELAAYKARPWWRRAFG